VRDDADNAAKPVDGAPSEVATEMSKGTTNESAGRPTEVVDALGRRHRHDSRGRFCKQDGGVDKRLLPEVDGRSLVFKRYKEIASAILADQAGVADSEVRRQLIRRFSAAACLAEQLEIKMANGEQISIAEHATLSSTLVRLAQPIGINRATKPTEGVFSYIARKYPRTEEPPPSTTHDGDGA